LHCRARRSPRDARPGIEGGELRRRCPRQSRVSPNQVNLIPIADILDSSAEFSHPFYKALWYWHEVEARISQWRARLPMLKFVRFETDWFNDANKVFELFDELDIRYERPPIEAVIGKREHTKAHQKIGVALPAERVQEMASRFAELLESLDLPHRSLPDAARN